MDTVDLSWKSAYVRNIPTIDHQHQYFFLLIKRILERADQEDWHKVKRLVEELFKYTQFHFKSEENLMEFSGYPELDNHRQHHFDLVEQLQIKAAYFTEQRTTPEQFISFLVDWLVNHTTKEDMEFAAFYNQHSVE